MKYQGKELISDFQNNRITNANTFHHNRHFDFDLPVYQKANAAEVLRGVNHMTDPKEQPEEVKAPATETEQEQVPGEATQEETEG